MFFSSTHRWICDPWWNGLWCHWGAIWGGFIEHALGVTFWAWSSTEYPQCRSQQPEDSAVEIRDEERQQTAGHAKVRRKGSPCLFGLDQISLISIDYYMATSLNQDRWNWKICACFVRFSLNSEVNLKTALHNMGLGGIFNLATADFTRITCKLTTNFQKGQLVC